MSAAPSLASHSESPAVGADHSAPAPAAAASSASAASASRPSRAAFYSRLRQSVQSQLAAAPSAEPFSLCANIAALLYHEFAALTKQETGHSQPSGVNWVGFYVLRNCSSVDPSSSAPPQHALLLGPFHGQPAVSVIRLGAGVCGTACVARATQLVPDVHAHPNHIACDSASQSEIVVPLFSDKQQLVGVLDIDSPQLAFFQEEDQIALEDIAKMLTSRADWACITDTTVRVKVPTDDVCPMAKPKAKH